MVTLHPTSYETCRVLFFLGGGHRARRYAYRHRPWQAQLSCAWQDRQGKALLRKKFSRKQLIEFLAKLPACTVVMEACAGAHHMARLLAGCDHAAKLISPQLVRPFVKSNKNDFIDAEAICEAACRPSMRFVTPKTEAQQCLSALHRVRETLGRERVKASNQIHGFLLEFGISLPVGDAVIRRLPALKPRGRTSGSITSNSSRRHPGFFRAGRTDCAVSGLIVQLWRLDYESSTVRSANWATSACVKVSFFVLLSGLWLVRLRRGQRRVGEVCRLRRTQTVHA